MGLLSRSGSCRSKVRKHRGHRVEEVHHIRTHVIFSLNFRYHLRNRLRPRCLWFLHIENCIHLLLDHELHENHQSKSAIYVDDANWTRARSYRVFLGCQSHFHGFLFEDKKGKKKLNNVVLFKYELHTNKVCLFMTVYLCKNRMFFRKEIVVLNGRTLTMILRCPNLGS